MSTDIAMREYNIWETRLLGNIRQIVVKKPVNLGKQWLIYR